MIVIIDYGMGNLRSVQKGLEKVGAEAVVSGDPAVVAAAEKVILPGVGAFNDAMLELTRRGLVEVVKEAIRLDKPFLGICLGLQLLFERGYEDGVHEGLGVFGGEVVRFDPPAGGGWKVPHMGWNELRIRRPAPLLEGVPEGAHMYFVHSYYAKPTDPELTAAESSYPDPFTAMIWKGNVFAAQFHPEKSQADGLRILRNFSKYARA